MNILWDFDGTIFDTYPIMGQLFKEMYHVQENEKQISNRLRITYQHAIDYYGVKDNAPLEFETLQMAHLDEVKPFSGVEKILKMADRNFIVTHKTKASVFYLLEKFHLSDYFTIIIGREDGFPKKPNDKAYRFILEKYPIDLVVGDRPLDLQPAKGLGVQTCLFNGNVETDVADYHVKSYKDLLKLLKNLKEKK